MTVIVVPVHDAEVASDRLWGAGARAVEERDVGERMVELRTSLGSDDAIAAERLGPVPPTWTVRFVDVDPTPADTWRAFASPVEVASGLVIRPAWHPPLGRPGVIEIAVEPGTAFGIGDHPTTRLSAAAVARTVSPGDRVLDVGTGTGVLAVIAARLGASHVVAIDITEGAREAATDNARRNGVEAVLDVSTTPLAAVDGRFDVVAANILAPVLVDLAPDLRRVTAPGGRLILSGVLTGGYEHVLDALAPMRVTRADELDGWACVELDDRRDG